MSDWNITPPAPELPPPFESTPDWNQPETGPHWGFRDIGLFVVFILPCLIVAFTVVKLFVSLIGWSGHDIGLELLSVQFVFYALWFLALYFVVAVRYDKPFWDSLAWTRGGVPWLSAALLGLLTAAGTIAVGILLKAPPTDQLPIQELLKSRLSMVVVGFLAVTVGPVFEELTFRGFLLPVLTRQLGVIGGIVLSSIPFALLHGPQYGWAWQQVLIIILVGCVFGWMRIRSGSTLTTSVMHCSYNLVFTVLLLGGVKEINV